MAIDINLLPELGKQKEKRKKLNTLLYFVGIGIFSLTVIILIASFFVKTWFGNQYSKVQSDIETQKAILKQYEPVEIQLTEVKQRTTNIVNILEKRKSYVVLIDKLEKITPSRIAFSTLSIGSDDTISMTGTCPSYDELYGFIKYLNGEYQLLGLPEPENKDPLFSNVKLLSVGRNQATYDLNFSISLVAQKGAYSEK